MSLLGVYDDGPVEFDTTMYGKIHVWRENKALDLYAAKAPNIVGIRRGFGESPGEAAKDLFRELSLKDVEDYEDETGQYEVTVPLLGDLTEGLVPQIWIDEAQKYFHVGPKPEKFYTAKQPTGTVIRIKGSYDTYAPPHGWVYEKFDANAWNTTCMTDNYSDETVQTEADTHGFDVLYTPEVKK